MRKDKLIVLAAVAAVVLAAIGFRQLQGENRRSAGPAYGTEALAPARVGEFRGFSLQMHNSDPGHPYEQYVEEIARTGANTICFIVTALQEHGGSSSIFLESRKTPPADRIRKLVALAHEKGLQVVLMPIVLLANPREGEWRGKIEPAKWSDWWNEYDSLIMHLAYIAQDAKVDVFLVGSELVSTEKQEDQWRKLIRRVRGAYHGRLSYSANWDHYKPIKWWDDLDIVGMTTYYDLTGGDKVTIERLMKAWEPIKKEILDWQAKINRPILFTEVGWPNQVTCAQYPWDYYRSTSQPDQEAQSMCFEAFFKTWMQEKSVAGMLVWEWRNHPDQKIGPDDTSYVPCGKKAMDVIRTYFQAPSPWGTTNGRLAGAASKPTSQPASAPGPLRAAQIKK